MNIPIGKMGWLNKYAEVVDRYRYTLTAPPQSWLRACLRMSFKRG